MKKAFAILSLGLLSNFYAQETINFDDYFTDGSLRIDMLLNGSHQQQEVSIYQLKKEPFYGAGSSAQLIYPNYGNYRLQVKDAQSGKLIFSKGFSPIFSEWQGTPEAKERKRSFENTLQIPYPKKEVLVDVQHRTKNGTFETLLEQKISPEDYHIIKETPYHYPTKRIYGNKPSSKAVDIAVLADGYTKEEMAKFEKDTRKFIDYMFTIPPFSKHREDFNVYLVRTPSQESGTDIPGENVYKNTILNSKFYTFDTPRYLTTLSMFKLADLAANVPYDQLFVIVNTDRYGGGGFYNVINLVSADDALSDKVFVHEFGHGFVGLGDEYYDANGGAEGLYNFNIEPWEPNLTTMVDFKTKWQSMIKKNTPIPTPRISTYENTVGVFEGGGYSPKDIYSPVMDCRMKSNRPDGFCPVCSDAIEKTIQFYTK